MEGKLDSDARKQTGMGRMKCLNLDKRFALEILIEVKTLLTEEGLDKQTDNFKPDSSLIVFLFVFQ